MRHAFLAFPAFLACLFAVTAAPASVQPGPGAIDFGFAPPIGTILRYEIVRTSEIAGRTRGGRLVRDYRFDRNGSGYLLWVELRSVESVGDESSARLIEAATSPMIGVRYAIEIGADGEPGAIREQAAVWQHVLEGIAHIEADYAVRTDITDVEREQMAQIVAHMRTRSTDGQREDLLVVARDLLVMASRSIAPGESAYSETSGPFPFAGTMTASLAPVDVALVTIDATAPGEGETLLHETTRDRAAPSSGLVHVMERTRRIGPENGPAEADLVTTQSLRLLEELAYAEGHNGNAE
jgi:hypothetical protein